MFVMHRHGWFKPSKSTKAQCKVTGHRDYNYHVILVCSEELDENGFLIDHVAIDDAIQKAKMFGSCEKMQLTVYNTVLRVLKKSPCDLLGYKCILSPTLPNGPAYMEYSQLLTSDVSLIPQVLASL